LNQSAHNKKIKNAKSTMNKEMKNDTNESPLNSSKSKSKDSSVIENLLKSFGISQ
jgi:hypothetical protein